MTDTGIIVKIIIGVLVGIGWGAAASFVNYGITRRAVAKNSAGAVVSLNFTRNLVAIAALAVVFLLRKVLPFNYEATLISTAITLSISTIFITFRLSKEVGKK